MKRFVDVVTVLLLTASFGMAFYTGFIGKNTEGDHMLATNLFAVISMAGVIILYVIGAFSTVIARSKMNLLTIGSLIFNILQFVCVVGVCVIMTMLWSGMFGHDNSVLRLLYLLFIIVLLVGYVDSLLFADSFSKREMFDEYYEDEDGNEYLDYLPPQASISPANRED